jgi:cysteine desulfurase/selenocysteine lyase
MLTPLDVRALFPRLHDVIFMNHAAVSLLSTRTRDAIVRAAEELTGPYYPDLRKRADELRAMIGALIHAPGEGVALTRSTAHGFTILAQGLDWKAGDNVVGARGEYPANVYPWMALARQGVELRFTEPRDGRIIPEAVMELVDERTRVVTLSHVQFWNGYRVDIARLAAECHRRGIICAVDVMQSLGALRVDVENLQIDFLASGACKWLLGPAGISFCYCRLDLLERLQPVLVGAGSVRSRDDYFNYALDFPPTGRRFEETWISLLDVAAFSAAVELLQQLDQEAVEQRVLALNQRLAEGLSARGLQIVAPWPRSPAESSSIVSFRHPTRPAEEVFRFLAANRVICSLRSDFVRLSPHYYNTEEEIDCVLKLLESTL